MIKRILIYYAERLSMLSDTMRFIRGVPKFTVEGTGYTIEGATVSTQDMNSVWTLLSGSHILFSLAFAVCNP